MFADPEGDPPQFDTFDIHYLIGLTLIAWAMLLSLGCIARMTP